MANFSSLLRIVYFLAIFSPHFSYSNIKDGRHFRVYHLFTTSAIAGRLISM